MPNIFEHAHKVATYANVPGMIVSEANYTAIKEYFQTHLCATQKECSQALGISVFAIGRHVKAIREEWRK